MNAEIAEFWAQALEDGNNKQGKSNLTLILEDGTEADCCLGVLCKLAILGGLSVRVETSMNGLYKLYDDQAGYPPVSVRDWAGLRTSQGLYQKNDYSLAEDNDSRDKNFTEIAAIIREHANEL